MKNYTILLAEDEKGTQEELYDILNFMCKEVYLASDGLEAKALYEDHKPDLIITDVQMPKLSGLELVKSIRKKDSQTSIAIVSAYTNTDYLLLATELHLLKYLVKPISKSKLLNLFELFKREKEVEKIMIDDNYAFYPNKNLIETNDSSHILLPKETAFLLLIHRKKSIINYYELESLLELEEKTSDTGNAIRQFIKKIRKKLPKDYIRNVQGEGYTL